MKTPKEANVLNTVLKFVGLFAAATVLDAALRRPKRSGQINTEKELEAVLRLHGDWILTEHIPSGTHVPFVVAPDGSVCLARIVGGETHYYRVRQKLVKQVCALA